jgi:hypothetical protein
MNTQALPRAGSSAVAAPPAARSAPTSAPADAPALEPLPTVRIGRLQVTRLIIGGNPFRGYSHQTQKLDDEMRTYYTQDAVVAALLHAQSQGLNAMVMRGDQIIMDAVRAYRRQGGTMQWLGQMASEKTDKVGNIREMAACGASAIYLHGSEVDKHWKAGAIDSQRDLLKAIRDTGLAVGMASHMPEVHDYAEDHGWDLDFHMVSFYNLSKIERGSMLAGAPRVDEPFDDPDREVAAAFIRQSSKPCLAYKILGAGRKCDSAGTVRDAFQFAFARIKPGDAVVVGMFQKHMDQVADNARIVREICAKRSG